MIRAVGEILAFAADRAFSPLPVGTIVLVMVSRRARRLQVTALGLWVLLVAA
ncbi:hypothetical protein [Amycolatopsis methanolica]|uniref:Uncharacterized protein n=1 Tax=Amycolatopsis methanolica 239 TaxID=1068978 RepID=A0A076MY15_AMYME|nr:hypothetical protein [Amycolatopsis methanolica]AIJ23575.1 hypothetical protein AMETH_3483 [Amycolatopsis methanolica 239]